MEKTAYAPEYRVLTGNEAVTLGALAAGMNFFAGYPITPATEIAELASELLPKYGGKYMQMEDELASMAAVIGASFAGSKAMTATSGPGCSLMQENLSYGMLAEVPCVLIDVMRQGPCQGVATMPAQGDIMQSRWGTHGDHPIIVTAPSSVEELYRETARAFNMAEKYRTPVMVLSDAAMAHMSEKIRIPAAEELCITNRKKPDVPKDRNYKPYEADETDIPPMASFGDGYRWFVSGIIHDETGFPATADYEKIAEKLTRIERKIDWNIKEIESYEEYRTDDAEIIIVAIGIVSRVAKGAIDKARKEGVKAGLFRPITLWPFPDEALQKQAAKAKKIITAEMNDGQLSRIVKELDGTDGKIEKVTRNDGALMTADMIYDRIMEVK
ncbi:MAG: 2-oxoacid:acceptor oxidoreductase subunit alpha [Eubacteriaceae bacterium]|jgi:2-oxoglutarate ferredoxin oxidoreductase subunit alpha|nr:2-oxoacid:acceptor oxidoreductase subunit alpha [Eubacteriaceae bacterium]